MEIEGGSLPTRETLIGLLSNWANAARNLEDGLGSPDLAKENHLLKSKVEEQRAKINVLATELDGLLKAQEAKEKAEKGAELPEPQYAILKHLDPQSGRPAKAPLIASWVNMDVGDVEVHLERLLQGGYVEWSENAMGAKQWRRNIKGSEYLIQKRASEE